MSRLYNRIQAHTTNILYQDIILKQNIVNILQVPTLKKITVHCPNDFSLNTKAAVQLLSGRYACYAKTRRSRGSVPDKGKRLSVGSPGTNLNEKQQSKIDLRSNYVNYFLDNLVTVVLPRIEVFNLNQMKMKLHDFNLTTADQQAVLQLENFMKYFSGLNISVMISINRPHYSFVLPPVPAVSKRRLCPLRDAASKAAASSKQSGDNCCLPLSGTDTSGTAELAFAASELAVKHLPSQRGDGHKQAAHKHAEHKQAAHNKQDKTDKKHGFLRNDVFTNTFKIVCSAYQIPVND